MTTVAANARAASAQWLATGVLLTFCSGFGQTYFIALFGEEIRRELGIGNGAFGAAYMAGTLVSSVILIPAGRVADRPVLRWISAAVLAGLAVTSAAMAAIPSAWLLAPVFLGLRFFGQGMLIHIALTAMARWFDAGRGKAIAVAAMGNPVGQAVLPSLALALSGMVGWRLTWLAGALFLMALSIPATLLLLRSEPGGARAFVPSTQSPAPRHAVRQWTRREVLRDPVFWLLLPALVAPSFVTTGIFFNQAAIVEAKGWPLAWFVGWFALNAAAMVAAGLLTGWVVDRFGSLRVVPVFLLPQAGAAVVLAIWAHPAIIPLVMVLLGVSLGVAATLLGTLWAELYGTRHLGSIRAIAASGGVFSSALAPGLMGVLLDWPVSVEVQLTGMALLSIMAAGLATLGVVAASRRPAIMRRPG